MVDEPDDGFDSGKGGFTELGWDGLAVVQPKFEACCSWFDWGCMRVLVDEKGDLC